VSVRVFLHHDHADISQDRLREIVRNAGLEPDLELADVPMTTSAFVPRDLAFVGVTSCGMRSSAPPQTILRLA
jgi:hypothetical protein